MSKFDDRLNAQHAKVDRKREEIHIEADTIKRLNKKSRLGRRLFMLLLAAAGYVMLVYYASWQIAVAIFLLQYAHNFEKHFER